MSDIGLTLAHRYGFRQNSTGLKFAQVENALQVKTVARVRRAGAQVGSARPPRIELSKNMFSVMDAVVTQDVGLLRKHSKRNHEI